jgi:FkbM family methyltransferase
MSDAHSIADISYGGIKRPFYFRGATSDEDVVKHIFQQQQYSLNRLRRAQELTDFVKAQERTGKRPLIVDAGANIGASAVYFILTFPNACVVAIEPDRGNHHLLSKNTQGLHVKAYHAAICSTKGRMQVFDPGIGHWGYRTRLIEADETGAGSVPCLRINDLYDEYGRDDFPFIVKVDIEGAERDLFAEATEWVAKTPVVIVELHDWLLPKQGVAQPFLKCVSSLNRDFVQIGEDAYSIANDLG